VAYLNHLEAKPKHNGILYEQISLPRFLSIPTAKHAGQHAVDFCDGCLDEYCGYVRSFLQVIDVSGNQALDRRYWRRGGLCGVATRITLGQSTVSIKAQPRRHGRAFLGHAACKIAM
jgi:hypothetical protein